VIIFCCTEFHRVLHGVTQSFFSPSCYFVIIFCCIELHGVLHGVTQSFFSSFVLLCDNFLLHRVARSFVRCFTELLFPPYYFVIIFCCTEFHRVIISSVLLYDNFCCTDSRRVLLFPLCYSVSTLWHSVKLFFYCTQSIRTLFPSVLLCEYSVVLCETFFLLHTVSQSSFFLCATLWYSVKLFFYYTQSLRALFSSVPLC